jgi:hypothetical protein
MSKPIVLSEPKWNLLRERLLQDHPKSVMLVSRKTREVLGFTVRYHEYWEIDQQTYKNRYKHHVCLDFYNEPKRTMFMLKYSEYLEKNGKNSLDF